MVSADNRPIVARRRLLADR